MEKRNPQITSVRYIEFISNNFDMHAPLPRSVRMWTKSIILYMFCNGIDKHTRNKGHCLTPCLPEAYLVL